MPTATKDRSRIAHKQGGACLLPNEVAGIRVGLRTGGSYVGLTFSQVGRRYGVTGREAFRAASGLPPYDKLGGVSIPPLSKKEYEDMLGLDVGGTPTTKTEGLDARLRTKQRKYLTHDEAQYVRWLRFKKKWEILAIADEMDVSDTTVENIIKLTGKWSYLASVPITEHDPRYTEPITSKPRGEAVGTLGQAMERAGVSSQKIPFLNKLHITQAYWQWGRDTEDDLLAHIWRIKEDGERVRSGCGRAMRVEEADKRLVNDKHNPHCRHCDQVFSSMVSRTNTHQSHGEQPHTHQEMSPAPPVTQEAKDTPEPAKVEEPVVIAPSGELIQVAEEDAGEPSVLKKKKRDKPYKHKRIPPHQHARFSTGEVAFIRASMKRAREVSPNSRLTASELDNYAKVSGVTRSTLTRAIYAIQGYGTPAYKDPELPMRIPEWAMKLDSKFIPEQYAAQWGGEVLPPVKTATQPEPEIKVTAIPTPTPTIASVGQPVSTQDPVVTGEAVAYDPNIHRMLNSLVDMAGGNLEAYGYTASSEITTELKDAIANAFDNAATAMMEMAEKIRSEGLDPLLERHKSNVGGSG